MYDKYNFSKYREYLKKLKDKNIRIEGDIINIYEMRSRKRKKLQIVLANIKSDQIADKHLKNEHLNVYLPKEILDEENYDFFKIGNTISLIAKVHKYRRQMKYGIITTDYGISYLNKSKINLIKKVGDQNDIFQIKTV
jgi:hypothetical protein